MKLGTEERRRVQNLLQRAQFSVSMLLTNEDIIQKAIWPLSRVTCGLCVAVALSVSFSRSSFYSILSALSNFRSISSSFGLSKGINRRGVMMSRTIKIVVDAPFIGFLSSVFGGRVDGRREGRPSLVFFTSTIELLFREKRPKSSRIIAFLPRRRRHRRRQRRRASAHFGTEFLPFLRSLLRSSSSSPEQTNLLKRRITRRKRNDEAPSAGRCIRSFSRRRLHKLQSQDEGGGGEGR